jgi:hypothetical protein
MSSRCVLYDRSFDSDESLQQHSGKETRMSAYDVQRPCILIVDSSTNRLRMIELSRAKNFD